MDQLLILTAAITIKALVGITGWGLLFAIGIYWGMRQ
ncbi:hypothetical protein PBI_CJW1_90 [Mycobacterium phage Cjw1]|uniref:Uncharacterized protein n=1 Tax=Mycobacterium phage Cjw1 TaxID=2907830 RepID=Q857S1_9CAUD|nr:gp91 [Mycobacterium phage Cjw1]YP_008051715.1 hypothetical protein PBI_DUMBO_90 [Mycobacterium phage Dumbo]AAN01705.1 hypothetical protein PBI_CJW1_90 [Mycobacterium phage Cjw1]AGM12831.1 hypothetical protein PBI_DUMBO_90 [Mycobacterium phage Dumbo]